MVSRHKWNTGFLLFWLIANVKSNAKGLSHNLTSLQRQGLKWDHFHGFKHSRSHWEVSNVGCGRAKARFCISIVAMRRTGWFSRKSQGLTDPCIQTQNSFKVWFTWSTNFRLQLNICSSGSRKLLYSCVCMCKCVYARMHMCVAYTCVCTHVHLIQVIKSSLRLTSRTETSEV